MRAGADAGLFVALGRELFGWLDGDRGQLSALLERAARPLIFEVQGPPKPPDRAWALLRAPFELLAAPGGGFLAEDELARFCVVRRLGPAGKQPGPGRFRLGVAFMASAPRGQPELDFEAEEAAILAAVGESRVDLVVDDTGDPEQLAHRLAELGDTPIPVVHLSCHGVNNWPDRPGARGVPVLMMENDVGGGRPTTAADLVSLLTIKPRLLFVSACLTAVRGLGRGGAAYRRGDVNEALRIYREVQLPAFERLGSTREAAVTWGQIADIAYRRGDYDEAAELQRKRLEVNKQLGDLDGIAASDWGLARIDLARQDYEAALPRLIESFQIFGHLQRPDGIAAVGSALGQLLMAAGQTDSARQVLGDSVAAATKIGWTDMAQQINELLNPPPK